MTPESELLSSDLIADMLARLEPTDAIRILSALLASAVRRPDGADPLQRIGGVALSPFPQSADFWHVAAPTDAAAIFGVSHDLDAIVHEFDSSEEEVLSLLAPVLRAALAERRRVGSASRQLTDLLTPSLVDLDPVPWASIEQAHRLAALKTELLASGAFTYRALADGRDATPAAIRQFVRRARDRNELFTVDHDGEKLVPAFLLSADLEPRPEAQRPVSVLRECGEDGWALWAWFASPSGWLDGRRPLDLLADMPDLVGDAARRRANNTV